MFRKRLILELLMLVALSLFVLGSLARQRPDEDRRYRVEVEAVNVLVTVTRKDTGDFNKNLNKEDFRVYEDGVEQEITNFSRETNLPLTIALSNATRSTL